MVGENLPANGRTLERLGGAELDRDRLRALLAHGDPAGSRERAGGRGWRRPIGVGIALSFAYAGFPVTLMDLKPRPTAEAERASRRRPPRSTRRCACSSAPGRSTPAAGRRRRADRLPPGRRGGRRPGRRPRLRGRTRGARGQGDGAARGLRRRRSRGARRLHHLKLPRRPARRARGRAGALPRHALADRAYLVPLVEVSPGDATDPAALRAMMELLERAGKTPVEYAASPGFTSPASRRSP